MSDTERIGPGARGRAPAALGGQESALSPAWLLPASGAGGRDTEMPGAGVVGDGDGKGDEVDEDKEAI